MRGARTHTHTLFKVSSVPDIGVELSDPEIKSYVHYPPSQPGALPSIVLPSKLRTKKKHMYLCTHALVYLQNFCYYSSMLPGLGFLYSLSLYRNGDWHISISLPIPSLTFLFCRARLRPHSRKHSFLPGRQVSVRSRAGM